MTTTDRSVSEKRHAERLFEVCPGVYRIPLPTDFPVGDINAYFVDGPDPVLIDTGVTGEANLDLLAASLGALGRRIPDISTLLLTHTHVDHAGSARAIQEASGCVVRIHPRGIPRLADVEASFERDAPWFSTFFARSGLSPRVLEGYAAVAKIFLRYTESCPGLTPLESAEEIQVAGGRKISAHETLGHTTSHVVYTLDDAVVFTGDHLLPEITANPTLEAPAAGDRQKLRQLVLFQESLARLAAMPMDLACPGHGAVFSDVAGRCAEVLEHQRRRTDKVLRLLREQGRMSRRDLSLALFGKVNVLEIYLTLSEVQAAVELLESEGLVRIVPDEDVDWIEAIA